jgi:sec-independent protein translocase protein TatB
MMRDANLDEVRSSINEIRNFDIRGQIERTVDPDGSLRDTFASNPLEPAPTAIEPEVEPVAISEAAVAELERPPDVPPEPEAPRAPAFIPPNMVPPPERKAADEEAPAFIPPEVVQERRSRQSV